MSNDSPPAKKLPPIVRKVAGKIRRSLFPPPPPPPPPPTPPPPPPIVWVPQLSLSEPLPTLARNVWKHSRLHTDPFRPLPLDNPTARSSATFISPVNEIYQVGALIGTFGRVNHATLVAELYESGTLVASAELSANNFKDNEWNYFTFTPVTGVLNKEITIAFHSPDGSSDNCVAMWETSYGFGSEDRAWSSTPSLDLASPTRATTHFFPWCSLLTYNGQQVKCIGWRGLNHTCDYVELERAGEAILSFEAPLEPFDTIELVFGTHRRNNICTIECSVSTVTSHGEERVWSGNFSAELIIDTTPFALPIPREVLHSVLGKWTIVRLTSPDASESQTVAVLGSRIPKFTNLPSLKRGPQGLSHQIDYKRSYQTTIRDRKSPPLFRECFIDQSRPLSIVIALSHTSSIALLEYSYAQNLAKSLRALGHSVQLEQYGSSEDFITKASFADIVFLGECLFDATLRTVATEVRTHYGICIALILPEIAHTTPSIAAADLEEKRRMWLSVCNERLLIHGEENGEEIIFRDIIAKRIKKNFSESDIATWLKNTIAEFRKKYLPSISIVTVLYRKEREIPFFLEALTRQDYPGSTELIVVDDKSPDGSRAALLKRYQELDQQGKKLPKLTLLTHEENSGNCTSRATGLTAVTGDIIVIVDCDCVLNRSFLSAHAFSHLFHEAKVVVGACNIETNHRPPIQVVEELERSPSEVLRIAELQDKTNLSSFVNCITRNFSIQRECITEQLADEAFNYSMKPESGFGWEDVEMGYRLYKRGLTLVYTHEAFSVHISHPPSTEEKSKPFRSLKNFRRLLEKHPDLYLEARRWCLDTFHKIEAWSEACGNALHPDQEWIRSKVEPFYPYPFHIKKDRPLKILTYRWHCPHQYELYKLPHTFTLLKNLGTGFTHAWNFEERPFPRNVLLKESNEVDLSDFDLLILHLDENVLSLENCNGVLGTDWGASFIRAMEHIRHLPKVAICHGTPQFYGQYAPDYHESDLGKPIEESRKKLVEYLKDVPVVCNSHQAAKEWQFVKSRVIWQGFDPTEFAPTNYQGGILTIGRSMRERPHYRGYYIYEKVRDLLPPEWHPQGLAFEKPLLFEGDTNDYAVLKYQRYRDALRRYSVYFNPTIRSPMPRARGEAMMSGLATVNYKSHDVDLFIKNGENGFYSESPEELAENLKFLMRNPRELERIGAAARRTAADLFNHDRYLHAWQTLIGEVLSGKS